MTEPEVLDIEEEKVVIFEFDNQASVPIASVRPVTVDAVLGTDASPGTVLVGDPVIDNVRLEVLQRMRAGLVDVTYHLRCNVTDSAGLKHTCVKLISVKRL